MPKTKKGAKIYRAMTKPKPKGYGKKKGTIKGVHKHSAGGGP